jgi:outer membrane porin, OprD family
MPAMQSYSRAAPLVAFLLIVGCTATALRAETPASLAPQPAPELEQPSPERDPGGVPLPSFLQDTALTLHLRTFYFDGTQNTGTENEAWASGGWFGYQSGWLLDTFAMGATLYGSAPFYAPADKDGTILLAPGQEGYSAVGEAWGALRYADYALVKGYRQRVDQGYINPSDIRMTPYTFEGVTVGGQVGGVHYLAGYLWKIKPRNADTFVSMAEQAGATGSNGGVGLIGVQWRPWSGLRLDVSEQYGVDTFNTVYAKADYRYPVTDDWAIGLGAEFTDQRVVGAAHVANAAVQKWATQVGGARVQLIYRSLTLTGAFSITGSGNTIQNPWGTYPGFLALIDAPASQNFARANEKGWLIGVGYDFAALGILGLVGIFNVARGMGAIDPQTRVRVPDQTEFNCKIDYRPPWLAPTVLRVELAT